MVDGHQIPTGLQRGQVNLEHLGAVGQYRGHHVAGFEVEAPQGVDHLVGPTQELAGAELGAVRGHKGQVIGVLLGQCPKSEIAHHSSYSHPDRGTDRDG
jgi:hypothetical protein